MHGALVGMTFARTSRTRERCAPIDGMRNVPPHLLDLGDRIRRKNSADCSVLWYLTWNIFSIVARVRIPRGSTI